MKKETIDVILIFLIVVLISTTLFLIIKFDKDGFSCLANPINYFEKIKNVSCQCQEIQAWDQEIDFSNLTLSPSPP